MYLSNQHNFTIYLLFFVKHEEARAFFQFMVWLEQAADNNEHITEVSAAEKLKDFKE